MKTTLRTKLLILLFFIQFAGIANATNWYVDPSATGTNAGTSWTNAWKGFSSIVWGANGVKAGDTLYLSGGAVSQTYTSTLTVGASGTSGNPITIRVGQDIGHNGSVIFNFDSLGDSANSNGFVLSNCAYVDIDGSVEGQSKLQIINLRNTSTRENACAFYGDGSVHDIAIKYVTVANCNNGVRMNLQDVSPQGGHMEVAYSSFTNMRGDAAVTFDANPFAAVGFDQYLVHNNTIAVLVNISTGNGPDGVQGVHGTSVYNNTFRADFTNLATSSQHTDFFQSRGSFIKFYNNDIINIGDSGFDNDSSYFDTAPHDIWIYNNTFRIVTKVDQYPEYIRFYNCNSTLKNIKILNNTMIDNSAYEVVRFTCGSSTTGSSNEIKNNIWYNAGLGQYTPAWDIQGAALGSSFDINYNIYYGGAWINYLGTAYNATTWLASHEPNSSTSMPIFFSYSPQNINNDLHLLSTDSAAAGLAENLSSYFTFNKDGNLRRIPWTIGAYERKAPTITLVGQQ